MWAPEGAAPLPFETFRVSRNWDAWDGAYPDDDLGEVRRLGPYSKGGGGEQFTGGWCGRPEWFRDGEPVANRGLIVLGPLGVPECCRLRPGPLGDADGGVGAMGPARVAAYEPLGGDEDAGVAELVAGPGVYVTFGDEVGGAAVILHGWTVSADAGDRDNGSQDITVTVHQEATGGDEDDGDPSITAGAGMAPEGGDEEGGSAVFGDGRTGTVFLEVSEWQLEEIQVPGAVGRAGLDACANNVANFLFNGSFTVRLFTANHVPDVDDDTSDYPEPTFDGYAPVAIAGDIEDGVIDEYHFVTEGLFVFSCTGPTSLPQTVYGFWVATAGGVWRWAARFEEPFTFTAEGQSLSVVLDIRLRNQPGP